MDVAYAFDLHNIELDKALTLDVSALQGSGGRVTITPIVPTLAAAPNGGLDPVQLAQSLVPTVYLTDKQSFAEGLREDAKRAGVQVHHVRHLKDGEDRATALLCGQLDAASAGIDPRDLLALAEAARRPLVPLLGLMSFAQRRAVWMSHFHSYSTLGFAAVHEAREPNLQGPPWKIPLVSPQGTGTFLTNALAAFTSLEDDKRTALGMAIRLHQAEVREASAVEPRFVGHWMAVDRMAVALGTIQGGLKAMLLATTAKLREEGWAEDVLPDEQHCEKLAEIRNDIVHQADRVHSGRIEYIDMSDPGSYRDDLLQEVFVLRRLFEVAVFAAMGFRQGRGIPVQLSHVGEARNDLAEIAPG